MRIWKAHKKPVRSLAFSPDGLTLASAGADRQVCLWDLHTGTARAVLAGCAGDCGIAFSPDGRFLALAGDSVQVWATESWERLLRHPTRFRRACFSADGRFLFAAGERVWCWNVGGWDGRWALPAVPTDGYQPYGTGGLSLSPDGRVVASTHQEWNRTVRRGRSAIHLCDADTGEPTGALRRSGHTLVIAHSPCGRWIAGAYGPTIHVWDLSAGREIAALRAGNFHYLDLAFHPDGRNLFVVSNDRTVRCWDGDHWQERHALDFDVGKLKCLAIAPDGLTAAAGGDTGKVVIWDVDF